MECVWCHKPIAPNDNKVRIQGDTYHSACWDRKVLREAKKS